MLQENKPEKQGPFDEKQVEAFPALKQAFKTVPILALPQKEILLSLDTDA